MPYQQVTRRELVNRLVDRWEGTPFWSELDALDAINDTLRQWNTLVGVWRDTRDVLAPPASDDHLVALAPDYIIGRCRITIAGRPLDPTSVFALARIRPNWVYEYTDSGGDIPTQVQWWAPVGLYTIRIWPGNRDNTTLTVEGMAATPVLLTDDQYIQIGEEDLDAILDECLHVASFSHGGDLFARTIALHHHFLQTAGKRNARLLQSRAFRMYAGLDRGRTFTPLANPSVTPAFEQLQAITSPQEGR